MNYESGRGKEPLKMYLLGENKEKENRACRGGEAGAWARAQWPWCTLHQAQQHSAVGGGGATLLIIFLGWHYQETHDKHFIIDIWWLKRILTLVIIIYFFFQLSTFLRNIPWHVGSNGLELILHTSSPNSLQTGDVFSDIALPAFFLKKKTISSYSHFI